MFVNDSTSHAATTTTTVTVVLPVVVKYNTTGTLSLSLSLLEAVLIMSQDYKGSETLNLKREHIEKIIL